MPVVSFSGSVELSFTAVLLLNRRTPFVGSIGLSVEPSAYLSFYRLALFGSVSPEIVGAGDVAYRSTDFFITFEGKKYLLAAMLGIVPAQNFKLKLFTNNIALDDDLTSRDLTELSGLEYSAKTLYGDQWGAPAMVAGSAVTQYVEQSFSFPGSGSGASLWGYAVETADGSSLLWASKFKKSCYAENGAELQITPELHFTL